MLEMVVKLVLGTGIVAAALFGMRWAAARGMTARGGPTLRVVGRTGLTKSALVAVVEVGERRFLVGASDQGVRLLSELAPDADAAQDAPPADGTTGADAPTPGSGLVPDDLSGLEAMFGAVDASALAAELPDDLGDDVVTTDLLAHGTGRTTSGPRIGPLDRLREMTVRSHLREPIRAHRLLR